MVKLINFQLMTQMEFEELTGMTVPSEEFNSIHSIYMNCGDNIDKQQFCKEWIKISDNKVAQGLAITAEALRAELTATEKERKNMIDDLLAIAAETNSIKLRNLVVKMVGFNKYAALSLKNFGKILFDEDIEDLIVALKS